MVIGGIGAKKAPSDTFEIEVGYGIVEGMRGMGLATEALKLFIDYCFNSGSVKTIKAECLESNYASIRILHKTGFKKLTKKQSEEGLLILWSLKQV